MAQAPPSTDISQIAYPQRVAAQTCVSNRRILLPMELIEQVIRISLKSAPPDSALRFRIIRSLSQACRSFRRVAIRCCLQDITVTRSSRWNQLEKFISAQNAGHASVRTITSSAAAFASASASASSLERFDHLTALTICTSSLILSNSSSFLKNILTTLPNGNILMSITLTSLPVLTPSLLRLIAQSAPRLRYLTLDCAERLDYCCWACLQDSAECMVHSPIPHMFSDIVSLSTSFADAITPLTQLTHLSLGIFLSDEHLFIQHLKHRHTNSPRMPIPWSTSSPSSSPLHWSASVPDIPSSDSATPSTEQSDQHPHSANGNRPFSPTTCRQCQNSHLADNVAAREDYFATLLFNRIASLQHICMYSFFSGRLQQADSSAQSNETWHEVRFLVQRSTGGAQVCRGVASQDRPGVLSNR
ncbi:hypothetical protein BDV98DRAFT_561843 [Pterulicium gracile]|uniref:Uncharacterized protein n=1 Tax=Pterulicium gracile TaxID=1884261 RepID=A0A5C3QTU6_9AGAR|nr:hypothetical protein BDV98DRAFT_561843 [Pterula gracilis]